MYILMVYYMNKLLMKYYMKVCIDVVIVVDVVKSPMSYVVVDVVIVVDVVKSLMLYVVVD